ncbi:MAG: hypothetical protein R3E01_36485 [Pirellulaceae bacterium]
MKYAGIELSLAGEFSAMFATIIRMKGDTLDLPPIPTVAAVLYALLLASCSLRINSEWVRMAAFASAERLIGACDLIPGASPSKSIAAELQKEY